LKLGVGARALAMGEAYTALGHDPGSTYYNPAGIASARSSQLLLMHKEWLQDIRTEYIGGQTFLGDVAVAVSINTTTIGDIELRQQPGPSDGTFDAHNAALGVTLAYKFDTALSVGLTGKYLYEKILVDEASGLGIDVGALYSTPWDIQLGASLANLGSVSELDQESAKLPTLLRFGAAYIHPIETIDGTVTLASEVVSSSNESNSHVEFGGELSLYRAFALRAGYQTGYEGRGFTAGIGFRYDWFQLDYAFIPGRYDLGSTHTMSLAIEFR